MQRKENLQLKNELRQFSGSENCYANPLFGNYNYTDGVKYLAIKGECYWLIDYIFSHQILPKIKGQDFQAWKIQVNEDDEAIVTIEDGNDNVLGQLRIGYTDFPFNEFTLWMIGKTLLLPSEY